jgi:acyl-CoA synthetase (AMP-forming)/AMP-acid ligase II
VKPGSGPRRRPARRARTDSLQRRLHAQLERDANGRAIAFVGAGGEIRWRTWREFFEGATGYGRWLAEAGVRQGDVAVLATQSDEACARALMGALLLGAVPLLVAPPALQDASTHLREVLVRTCQRAGARVAVVPPGTEGLEDDAPRRGPRTRFLTLPEHGVAPSTDALAVVHPPPERIGAMQLTSGTTGFPRICVWKHRGIVAALDGMGAAMKLSSRDVCFNWTPLYHDMGLVNNFFLCLTSGVPVVMARPQDFIRRPALWLRGLSETHSTVTWSPNFGFVVAAQRIRDDELEGVRLDEVRGFYNAAERIHLDSLQNFYKRFAPLGVRPEALKTNFGCAENIGGATFSAPDGVYVHEVVDRTLLHRKGIARPVAGGEESNSVSFVGVGRPAPGLRVAVLSPAGRPLPDGRVGELALDTPSRMVGYLHQRGETRRALYRKWLRTGDLAYVRDREVFWVGRRRERINVRGRKFDPSDFEQILFGIPRLRTGCFAAFGIDDEVGGTQRLVIVAEVQEAAAGGARGLIDQIRERVSLQLGVVADEVVLVKSGTLTKTSSGKRRHRFFHQAYLDGRLRSHTLPGSS